MKNKYINKIMIVIFLSIAFVVLKKVYSASLDEYTKQLEEIKEQQKKVADSLTGVEKEIESNLCDIIELDEKIMTYTDELTKLEDKLKEVTEKIEEYENDLQTSSQKYNSTSELYETRLRILYENGIPNLFDIFFASGSITDFFNNITVYKSILEYDKKLISSIQSQKEYISYIKQDIEIQKLQLEQLTYDTNKSKQTLEEAVKLKEQKVASLNSNKATLQKTQTALAKQREEADAKIQAEIDRINAENAAKGNNVQVFAGDFAWPVPRILYNNSKVS